MPDAPALPVRDPWPGDAARGADLLKGLLSLGGSVVALRVGGFADVGGTRCCAPPRTASPGCATCVRSARTRRGCVPARWWANWMAAAHLDPIAERPDVAGARIAAWLGHYDFFAASADDGFRQKLMAPAGCRRPRPGGRRCPPRN